MKNKKIDSWIGDPEKQSFKNFRNFTMTPGALPPNYSEYDPYIKLKIKVNGIKSEKQIIPVFYCNTYNQSIKLIDKYFVLCLSFLLKNILKFLSFLIINLHKYIDNTHFKYKHHFEKKYTYEELKLFSLCIEKSDSYSVIFQKVFQKHGKMLSKNYCYQIQNIIKKLYGIS